MKHSKTQFEGLSLVEPNAAGIDIGASEHWVAVPADRAEEPVQGCCAYTKGLHELVEWLKTCGITTVAMESTGVYWVPLYELLEGHGFRVCLVNARHVKNVPGRKTDVLDCQWLQKLHSYGLLQASFRPDAAFVRLRTYLRHRKSLVKSASTHVQHIQKALTLMNVQLHRAVSDVTGATGMAIIREIVAGNHEPKALAKLRDCRCKASEEEIAEALRGEYRTEELFVLRQALELYDVYQSKLKECDEAILRLLPALKETAAAESLPEIPKARAVRKKRRTKEFLPPIREPLSQITHGVDLAQVAGFGELSALELVAEIGTDMSRWPTAAHFASWTTLAPSNRVTGGKRFASSRPPSAHPVAQILRLAALNAGRTQTAIGAFFRRLSARIGAAKAVVATAAKLARIIYTMLKHGTVYLDLGANFYEQCYRKRVLANLKHRAAEFGFKLVPTPPLVDPAANA